MEKWYNKENNINLTELILIKHSKNPIFAVLE
jgi:hypothetical protein